MKTNTTQSTEMPIAAIAKRSSAYGLSLCALFGLFILEISVFYWTVVHHVAPFYPIASDQTSYYIETYRLIADGWSAIFGQFIQGNHATGVSFAAQGAVLGLLFGAHRTVIVSINLFYFIILQLVLFQVTFVRTRNISLAWVSLALLFSCQTIFNGAGGIYDYRIDFSALCLYGVFICAILWSNSFRSTNRSLIVAAAAILLISLRYITALYAAALLGSLLVIFVVLALRSKSIASRALAWVRARNLLAAGAAISVIIVPLLFTALGAIYNYYVIGHVLGEEKYVRAHELGLYTFANHISYYPMSVYRDHLGWQATALMTFAVVAIGLIGVRSTKRLFVERLTSYGLDFLVLSIAIVVPIMALTADISKSSVVGGIVVVPIVIVVTLLCALFYPDNLFDSTERGPVSSREEPIAPKKSFTFFRRSVLRPAVVLIATVTGVSCLLVRGFTPPDQRPLSELRKITAINETIAQYLIQNKFVQPSISFDRVTDFMNWGTVILFGFERYHKLIDLVPHFGHGGYGLFATPRDTAMKLFMESDVIVLTDPLKGRGALPMDKKIPEYWDDIAQWTQSHRTLLYSTKIFDVPNTVYVSPPPSGGGSSK